MPLGRWLAGRRALRTASAAAFCLFALRQPLLAGDPPHPLHLTATAFGQAAEIDVRDLPASLADDAVRKAFEKLSQIETLSDGMGSAAQGLALLNVSAGKAGVVVDPELYTLLERAENFCIWSENIHGPLGGELNGIWGIHGAIEAIPNDDEVARATASAACGRLALDPKRHAATLAAGSRADLRGFAVGFAVDRAVDLLRAAGATNGWVRVGNTARAFGPGPKGRGWPFEVPPVIGTLQPERVVLRDRAIAVRKSDDLKLGLAGETWLPYLDQKRGRPGGQGVLLTAASTDLAVDSEALAVTMFAAGNRLGQSLLGSLTPAPAVLWLLGLGQGPPLSAETRWSQVRDH